MPFVHLANGEVLDLSDKEWAKEQENSGTPTAVHRDGKGSHVIGVYPSDYEYEQSDEQEKEDADKREFEQWKRDRETNRNNTTPNAAAPPANEVADDENFSDPLAPGEPVTIERNNGE